MSVFIRSPRVLFAGFPSSRLIGAPRELHAGVVAVLPPALKGVIRTSRTIQPGRAIRTPNYLATSMTTGPSATSLTTSPASSGRTVQPSATSRTIQPAMTSRTTRPAETSD